MRSEDAPVAPAATELFRAHGNGVLRAARYFGVAEADLDDVVQEVFLVAHRRSADVREGSEVRPWLLGICRRVAAAFRRRAHKRHEVPTGSVPDVPDELDAEARLAVRQARDRLAALLEGLDDEKREVFVLFEVEEVPMDAIARIIGCPLKTAYSRLYAARRLLREQLSIEGRPT